MSNLIFAKMFSIVHKLSAAPYVTTQVSSFTKHILELAQQSQFSSSSLRDTEETTDSWDSQRIIFLYHYFKWIFFLVYRRKKIPHEKKKKVGKVEIYLNFILFIYIFLARCLVSCLVLSPWEMSYLAVWDIRQLVHGPSCIHTVPAESHRYEVKVGRSPSTLPLISPCFLASYDVSVWLWATAEHFLWFPADSKTVDVRLLSCMGTVRKYMEEFLLRKLALCKP